MKKYIILLSATFLVLIMIFGIDKYFEIRRQHKIEENKKPQTLVAEDISSNVSASEEEPPKVLATKVPILMYHSISDLDGKSSLFVSPHSFESQINYLVNNNYSFIDFEDLDRGNIPKNPIILTFDDGYEDFYTNAYPILLRNNAKATVFIITGSVGKPEYLTLDEMQTMKRLVSFQSHTVSHLDLKSLDTSQLEKELGDSKKELEEMVKNKIVAVSYPSGSFNSTVTEVCSNYYKYGVTTQTGTYNIENNKFRIPSIRVGRKDTVSSLAGMIIRQ